MASFCCGMFSESSVSALCEVTLTRPGCRRRAKRARSNCRGQSAFNDAFGNSVTGQAGDIVDVQLIHDLLPMLLNGFDADDQFAGDLFVGETFGDELEHFGLARGEFAGLFGGLAVGESVVVLIAQAPGNDRAEESMPAID